MADKKGPKNQGGGASVSTLQLKCPGPDCTQKPKRAGFCEEHFVWFKEGLINRKGEKPSDFDKKYQAFTRREKTAA